MVPPSDADPTDEQLVSAALAGQSDAFRALFERHYAPLVRALTAQSGDPVLAEDLAQEAFLAAYRHLGDVADGRPFVPWLRRIAHNALRMEWRRQRLRRIVSLDWLFNRAGNALLLLARPDEMPEAACERDLIRQALAALSPEQRAALVLHDIEGLKAREVATILKIKPGAAERLVSRARAGFRRRYDLLKSEGS